MNNSERMSRGGVGSRVKSSQVLTAGLEGSRRVMWVGWAMGVSGSPGPAHPRFGAGHTLTLRVPAVRSEPAAAFVTAAFPGAELREAHGGRLRFQLPPGEACSLARVFGELAARGAEHGVEDFSVSQTTLEEVPAARGGGLGAGGVAGGQARRLTPPAVSSCLLPPPPARYSCTSLRFRGRTTTSGRPKMGQTLGQTQGAPNSSPGSRMTPTRRRRCCEPSVWVRREALEVTGGRSAWS